MAKSKQNLFEQEFLSPGVYHVGGGKFEVVTRDDIRNYVDETNRAIQNGNHVPVLLEHAEPGTDEGAPRDKRADGVKHGAGWLVDLKGNRKGNAVSILDVPNEEHATAIREKRIKFTSPELRKTWRDGKGQTYKGVVSHMALTHKPRNTDQSEITEREHAMQFSLDDRADVDLPSGKPTGKQIKQALKLALLQFAEGDEDEDGVPDIIDVDTPDVPDVPDNPDVPNTDDVGQQQLEALITLLEGCGLVLPADTTIDTLVRDLLTAVKTKTANDETPETPDADGVADDELEEPLEERGPMQFSLTDVNAKGFDQPLLAKVVAAGHAGLSARLDRMVRFNKITPALRDKLVGDESSIQFSDTGDEVPCFTVSQITALLDGSLGDGQQLDVSQLSADAFEESADSGNYQTPIDGGFDGELSPAEASALVDEQTKNSPDLYRQPVAAGA